MIRLSPLLLCWLAPFVFDMGGGAPLSSHRTHSPSDLASKEIDFNLLTNFEYEEGKPLPKKIQALDGKDIKIRGYMHPDTSEGTDQFLLVNDDCGCEGNQVHHFIDVTLTSGTVSYRPRSIVLEGTLSVGEEKEDGFVVSVYRLEVDSVD